MGSYETGVHLFAGACAGTAGAIVTCPLEVVKTRLQSSSFQYMYSKQLPSSHAICSTHLTNGSHRNICTSVFDKSKSSQLFHLLPTPTLAKKSPSVAHCIWYIYKYEGFRALWRGLLPNLVGVAPSRSVYFCTYEWMKKRLKDFNITTGHLMHIISATSAGLVCCTVTNPIWFIKTRLQLDRSTKTQYKLSVSDCIRQVYREKGIRGFFKGLTASYYGVSDTVIYFATYEYLKKELNQRRGGDPDMKRISDFIEIMVASGVSKTIASSSTYPHEVARTRLREEGNKYRTFWQTLSVVLKEEGWAGIYRGLATQLIRQIPNSAIMMLTYEVIIYYALGRDKYNEDDEDMED